MTTIRQSLLTALAVATTLVTSSAVHAQSWYWVPSRITNASAGRTVLSSDPKGMIGTLLGSLGQYYSHSGMFLDNGYAIRHNTMDPNSIKPITDWAGIPQRVNGATLLSAQPGLITQLTAEAFGDKGHPEFFFFDQNSAGTHINRNAAVLLRRDTGPLFGSWQYNSAAKYMTEYEAFYSFYSYTDIWSTEPDTSDPKHLHVAPKLEYKNMCSGTIAWALFRAGFSIWPWHYTAAVRDSVAPVLYSTVRSNVGKEIRNKEPFLGSVADFLGVTSSGKTRIANQVVNCMAFNDCYNTGSRWRDGVGAGMSISPDNHLPVGFINPAGVAWGISGYDPNNTYSQWYDSVEPISYSGGYWKKY